MGAGESHLTSQFSNIELLFPQTEQRPYSISKAIEKQSDRRVLIFSGAANKLQNFRQYAKTIRHPNILRYHNSHIVSGSMYIVTEFCNPLMTVVKDLSSQEICNGIYNIVEALDFLHEKCFCSFNNLMQSSIFVSEEGTWKLGCLENIARFSNASWQVLLTSTIPMNIRPPECDDEDVTIPSEYAYSRDVYMLGCMMNELLYCLKNLKEITRLFARYIHDDLLNEDFTKRPKMKEILRQKLFSNSYISLCRFLLNVLVANTESKRYFFTNLSRILSMIDAPLLHSRVFPLLFTDAVLFDQDGQEAVKNIMALSEDYASKITSDMYSKSVLPQIMKLFRSKALHTRLFLLKCFSLYCSKIPAETLSTFILPKLLQGLKDRHDSVVQYTFEALGHLIPILGGNRVVGSPRKRIFTEVRPSFHTDFNFVDYTTQSIQINGDVGSVEEVVDALESNSVDSVTNKGDNDTLESPSSPETPYNWDEWGSPRSPNSSTSTESDTSIGKPHPSSHQLEEIVPNNIKITTKSDSPINALLSNMEPSIISYPLPRTKPQVYLQSKNISYTDAEDDCWSNSDIDVDLF